jgi:voltage-dependent anion channel protein 2
MAPPLYADLGKTARDIFNKGYNYGTVKLDVKTRTKNQIDFNLTGEHNNDLQKSLGTLEAKYKSPAHGLTFVEKWNTDNILKSEITVEDSVLKGLKLALDTSYSPASGKKSGVLKTTYSHDKFNLQTDVDLDSTGPVVIHNALVVGHLGWLLGLQTTFDTTKSQLTRNNFAVGYQASDFTLHTNVNDGTEVGGSIYQKVNENLGLGVSLSWSSVNNATRFALASKYQLDQYATVQAKVNNLSQIGLSYTQQLRDGVKLVLSGIVDGKNINGGGHKLGLGLELEP